MSNITYESSVYKRTVSYTNFKGEKNETTLYFALDPLQLLQVMASLEDKSTKRSGNPAKRASNGISDEAQLKMVRDLAIRSAGFPSEDGETWEPFENFENTIAGKAFMTKLTSSDGDRREFSEKVILDPFRAFVKYAEADETNTAAEVQQFTTMLAQMENIFKMPSPQDETLEERRARLAAELESLTANDA